MDARHALDARTGERVGAGKFHRSLLEALSLAVRNLGAAAGMICAPMAVRPVAPISSHRGVMRIFATLRAATCIRRRWQTVCHSKGHLFEVRKRLNEGPRWCKPRPSLP